MALSTTQGVAANRIYRVAGTVTADNFGGLQAFLLNSTDEIVGLKVHFPAEARYGAGIVTAEDREGRFAAFMAESDPSVEVFARDGYFYRSGDFIFDSFYLVKYGGIHQGTQSVSLNPIAESDVLLSGRKVTEVEIGKLNSKIRK
jgi:hypothetical protein